MYNDPKVTRLGGDVFLKSTDSASQSGVGLHPQATHVAHVTLVQNPNECHAGEVILIGSSFAFHPRKTFVPPLYRSLTS